MLIILAFGRQARAQTTNINTVTNGGTISSGTVSIITNSVTNITGAITNNGSLQFWQSASTVTDAFIISGTGTVIQAGTGTTVLSGSNSYTGTTFINQGYLILTNVTGPALYNGGSGTLVINGSSSFTSWLYTRSSNQLGANVDLLLTNNGSIYAVFVLYGNNQTIGNLLMGGTNSRNFIENTQTETGVGNSTLTINQTTNATYSGYILDNNGVASGTLAIVKNGAATLTFIQTGSNNINYTGGTTVNDGALVLNDAAGTGVGVIRGRLTINTDASVILTNGSAALGWLLNNQVTNIVINQGSLIAAGTQTIFVQGGGSGQVTLNGGLMQVNGGVSSATTTNYFEWGNYAVNVLSNAVSSAISGRINIRNDVTPTLAFTVAQGATNGTDLLVSAAITDAGAGNNISKAGSGTMLLSGTNTYTGTTTISAGTLVVSGLLGNGNYSNEIANSSLLVFSNSGSQTLSGLISGAGTLVLSGNGTVTISYNSGTTNLGNTYSGGTIVNSGTVVASGPNNITSSLGTGNITINNGGTIYLNGDNSIGWATNRTVTINNGGILTNNGTASVNMSAVILNGGTLAGASAQVWGSYIFNSGLSTLGSSNTSYLTATSMALSQTGGTVFNIAAGATNGIDLLVTGTFTDPSSTPTTGLIKQGAGVMVLAGTNTTTNSTTISAGTLVVSGLLGSGNYSAAITNNALLVFSNSGSQTLSGVISGSGDLYQSGSGTTLLAGTNVSTGNTVVDSGALLVTGLITNTSYVGLVSSGSGATLVISNGGRVSVDAGTNNVGGLQIGNSPGSLSNSVLVTGSNSILAVKTTNIPGGGIQVGNDTNASGNSLTVSGGATASADNLSVGVFSGANSNSVMVTGSNSTMIVGDLTIGVSSNSGNTLTISSNATLQSGVAILGGGDSNGVSSNNSALISSGGTWNLTNQLTVGSGSSGNMLTVSGGGTLSVSNDVVIGASNVTAGSNNSILVTGSGSRLTANSSIVVGDSGGGTLTIGSGATVTAPNIYIAQSSNAAGTLNVGTLGGSNTVVTLNVGTIYFGNGNGTLNFNQAGATTLSAALSGAGSVNQYGSGTTVLTGNVFSLVGVYTVTNGALQFGDGSNNVARITNAVALSNGASVIFNPSTNNTFAVNGVISGNGGVTQTGNGLTILLGGNTYTGATIVNGGTLQVGTNGTEGSIGTGSVNLGSGGTLSINRSDALSLSNVISGAGSLTQQGSGTTILLGANNYTGATTVNGGTLQIGTNGTTGSLGSGTVNIGGTLLYNRSDSTTLSNVITGFGNLTFLGGGSTTLSGNSTFGGVTTVEGTSVIVTGAINGSGNGTFYVGNSNSGSSLTFTGGGTNSADSMLLGSANASSSNNTVVVNNATLTLASSLGVGSRDNSGNRLIVTNGGKVTGGLFYLGAGTGSIGSNNSTLITGSGSMLTTTNATGFSFVGNYSSGNSLVISNGASFLLGGPLYIGANGGSNNSVLVDNASLTNNGNASIVIGAGVAVGAIPATNGGGGILTVANGGSVSVNSITLASSNGTTATLNIGNFGANGAGGILNVGSISFGQGTGTLNFNQSNTVSVASTISGSNGTVNQYGTGTTILNGTNANTYSGGTFLNAGTLAISNSSSFGTGTVTFVSNATVQSLTNLAVANAYVISNGVTGTFNVGGFILTNRGVISGNGILAKTGTGNLVLTASNSYGNTVVSEGTLMVGTNGTNGTLGTGSISNNAALVFNRNNTYSVSNAIGGSGSLTQAGSGTTILTVSNSYVGGTWITNGTLAFTTNSPFGTGTVTLTNGTTLSYMGGAANDLANSLTIATGSSGIIVNSTNSLLTLSGIVSKNGSVLTLRGGVGGITVSGSITGSANNSDLIVDGGTTNGTVTLIGSNSYNGPTYIINGGTLNANSAYALPTANGRTALYLDLTNTGTTWGTGTSTLALGTNQAIASLSGAGSSTVSLGSYTLTIGTNASTNTVFAGTITGTGVLLKDGSSTQTLTASNSYTGGTLLTAGTLAISNSYAFGSGTVTVTNSGTIQALANLNVTNRYLLTNAAATFNVGGFILTNSGVINGNGTLTKIGAGTLVLAANNTYSGGTIITNGVLQIATGGTLGTGTVSISNNALLSFIGSDSNLVANAISGAGSLLQVGTGTTILSGSNSYTGGTLITAGTIRITSTNSLGAGSSTLTFNGSGATLQFGSSFDSGRIMVFTTAGIIDTAGNSNTLTGLLSGGGGLILTNSTGTGTLTLAQAFPSQSIGAGTLTVASGATLQFYGTLSNNIVNNGTLYWNNRGFSNSGLLSGTIEGTGSLVSAGTNAGTNSGDYLTLVSSNSYSGGTLIQSGTYIAGQVAGAFGSGTVTVQDGGTFWISASQTNALVISGTGGADPFVVGAIRFAGTNVVLSGPILLTGNSSIESAYSVTNSITGNVNLAGYALSVNMNAATEATVVSGSISNGSSLQITGGSGGRVILTGSNSYGSSVINAGNILQIGTNGTTGSLGVGGVSNSGSILFSRSDLMSVSNLIYGTGSLTQAGSGTLQLLANNVYTGTTLVSRGVLMVGNGGTNGSIGTNAVTVSTNTTLAFNRSDSMTIGNAISGAGSLSQLGSGTTILSGSNSYTGATLISNGTLLLSGTNTGGGGFNVSAAATLAGTGKATNSAVTAASGASITPGTGSSIGTLSVGSLTLSGGTLNILLDGGANSLLALNGTADLRGILNFSTNAPLTNSTYVFLTNSTGSFTNTFNTVTNLPTGYQVVYSSNSVYLQLISQLGPVTTAFAGTNAVITGGSTNFIVTVTNSAPSGSDNLVFTATNGTNVGTAFFGSTTLTPQSSTNISGVFAFNGTNIGSNQGTVVVNSTNSIPNTSTGTVTVSVFEHAAGGLLTTNVTLSNVIVDYTGTVTTNVGLTNSNGFRVALAATNISGTNASLGMSGASSLTAGSSTNLTLTFAAGQGTGTYSNNVILTYGDASTLSGATNNLGSQTLTVTQSVFAHASGSLSVTNVAMSNVIAGYSSFSTNLIFSNATGFRVALAATNITSLNTNLSLAGSSSLSQGSSSTNALTLAAGQGTGTYSNTITVVFGDASTLNGASSNVGSATLTVTGSVFDHAQGSLTNSNVTLRTVHIGYTNEQTYQIGMSNAAGFRVAMRTAATNSGNSLSLSGVSNVASNSVSNAVLTFSLGQSAGVFTNQIAVIYGDDSPLNGAISNYGTNYLTVSGYVYSGQSTWTGGSGNWTNFANWDVNGGTPGLDGSLSTNDTATFGAGSGTVTLDTNARLMAISFTNSPFTIDGSGTISLAAGSNPAAINNISGTNSINVALNVGTQVTITNGSASALLLNTPISGVGGLTLTGPGSTVINGTNTYTGSTVINGGGVLAVNGSIGGSTNVQVNNGTLAPGINGMTVNGPVSFTSALSVYQWTLFDNTTSGAGTNYTAPLVTTDTLSVSNGAKFSMLFASNVTSTNAFWNTPGATNSWTVMSGSNVSSGTNFGFAFAPGSITTGINLSYFSWTNIGTNLVLTYSYGRGGGDLVASNTVTTISGTQTNSSVTWESEGVLNITPSGNLTISTNVVIPDNATAIVNGTFIVTNGVTCSECAIFMGSGTLVGSLVNEGRLRPGNSPGTLTINGNFTQTTTGLTEIEVASASNFDHVMINGSAVLAGGLQITTYGGGALNFGDQYQFLTATGGITGAYDYIAAPAGYRGRFFTSANGTQGSVLIAPQSYTQLANSPNELSVARALDTFIPGSIVAAPGDCHGTVLGVAYSQPVSTNDTSVVSLALDRLTASQYQQAFNAIMPTLYQSLSTMAFNTANAQYNDLVEQMFGMRVAGTGFHMSGFDAVVLEGQGDGKSFKDPKSDILRPGADTHWGMFVDMNGIFAQANSGNMLQNYNAQSGGLIAGLTYKWSPSFATGIYSGYEGTYAKYGGTYSGSSVIDNAVRFGLLGTYGDPSGKGFYGDALVGGSYHNYSVTRVISFPGLNRTANSMPGAGELDSLIAAGYNWRKGNWAFGPVSSLQYTYFGMNSFNESGAQSLDYQGLNWNSSSMISSLGANCAYSWQATRNLMVVPQINLGWQHEFMQNPYNITGNLAGTGVSVVNTSAAPLRDTLYTGVGVTMEFAKKWHTAFFYNAAAGNADLRSQNFFWSLGLKF